MADYFTNFSLIITLPDETAQAYALDLAIEGSGGFQGGELPEDFPTELENVTEDWCFETEPDTAENNPLFGCIPAAAASMQSVLLSNICCKSLIFQRQ
jgi:hypothetical protein